MTGTAKLRASELFKLGRCLDDNNLTVFSHSVELAVDTQRRAAEVAADALRPNFFARLDVDGSQVLIAACDERQVSSDRGRAIDAVLSLELPQQLTRFCIQGE